MPSAKKRFRRGVVLGIRLTPEELQLVEGAALTVGMKTSVWVRWKMIEIIKRTQHAEARRLEK